MSTEYAERVRSLLPSFENAINSMPGDPSEAIPGLTKPAVIAFARSFEPLLERVDATKGVDFVHLVYGASNVPEAVLGVFGSVPSQAANGASYFVQNTLGNLLDLRNRLEAAAGPLDSKTAQPAQLRRRLSNLDTIIEEAAARVEGAATQDQRSRETLEQINTQVGELAETVEQLNQVGTEISQLRDKAKYIVDDESNPDEPSIAKIYADLNGRRKSADEQIKKIDEAVARANKAAAQTEQLKGNTDALRKDAQGVLEEARSAMRGATQVGLAESFITERDAKLRGLAIYGTALVIAVAGACVFAVWEVVPAVKDLTDAVKADSDKVSVMGISLLVRTVLLAPFVFLAWFAAVQYRRIDLLRIDYAAKAAAAKAYVGYKDEVKGDQRLVAALRAFLIQRFGEHPVRLVTKEHDEEVPLSIFGLGETPRQTPVKTTDNSAKAAKTAG